MNEISVALAKLAANVRTVSKTLKGSEFRRAVPISNFSPDDVEHLFVCFKSQLKVLEESMPSLFGDFHIRDTNPASKMSSNHEEPPIYHYSRKQLENLEKDIEQILEIRANSELKIPIADEVNKKVFVSHGRAGYWKDVQSYLEKTLQIPTLELEQEPNKGRTIIQKLEEESNKCSYAVIVMTGDDTDLDGKSKARENVMHEIGFFQGKYGQSSVCILYEEGTNIPSNIHGIAYIPFPKSSVNSSFGSLTRELNAFFGKKV